MPYFFRNKILLAGFLFLLCKTSFGQSLPASPANNPATISTETTLHKSTEAGSSANLLLAHNPHPDKDGVFQIKYALKIRGEVRLQVLDPAGHPLRTLVDELKERGSYTFDFDPASWFLTPGKYLYRLESNSTTLTRSIEW